MSSARFFPLLLLAVLTGCGIAPQAPTSSVATLAFSGRVHGGQQPVSGARVYLLAAGSAAYGGPSISLLKTGIVGTDSIGGYVLTDSGGNFNVTGDYACTPATQVYTLAEQGNPGLAAGTNNPALALMTALGPCPATGTLAATTPVVAINEVTTVAAVYALSGFMTGPAAVSSGPSAGSQTGLANAFATVNNLVNIANGYPQSSTPGPAITYAGVTPYPTVDTLANILAACVNTTGATAPATSGAAIPPCGALFANATTDGTTTGTLPIDTVTAALNIAHHPGVNVGALYTLSTATAPFQPALAAQPNDFNLRIQFILNGKGPAYGDYLAANTCPSVDASGNIVILGENQAKSTPGFTIKNNLGTTLISEDAGIYQSHAVAIDPFGFGWFTGYVNVPTLSKINTITGSISNYSAPGYLGKTYAIASDTSGNIFDADYTDQRVTEYSNSGTSAVANSPANNPATGLAVDSQQNFYLVAMQNNFIYQYSSGQSASAYSTSGGGLNGPANDALDGSGNLWVANTNSSISKFQVAPGTSGVALSPSTGFKGAGYTNLSANNYLFQVPMIPLVVDGGGGGGRGRDSGGAA